MRKFNKVLAGALLVSLMLISSGQVTLAASPQTVNLGTSGNFVILSKTGISTTGLTSVVGDIGVSPITASAITGFGLTLPSASAFSTSALVTGKVYASDYSVPTPSTMTTAVLDMQTAYVDAMGRASDVTELGAGNIGGLTLAPGVYKWGTGVTIPTNVTLSGGANDVWIFQIAQTLTVSSNVNIVLAGGAQANNIFWVVGGQTTIGTGAIFNGNILDQTAIVLNTGATLNGRALAQTAVTLDSNAVTMQTSSASTPPPVVTPTPQIVTSTGSGSTSGSTSQTGSGSTQAQTQTSTYGSLNTSVTATQLQAEIANLQLLQMQMSAQGSSASFFGQQIKAIAVNLVKGSRGENVRILQQFLISQNKGPSAQTLARVGATAYFGAITTSALAEFQANVGIRPALGNFGSITRSYISTH